jgi:hypothetical protein
VNGQVMVRSWSGRLASKRPRTCLRSSRRSGWSGFRSQETDTLFQTTRHLRPARKCLPKCLPKRAATGRTQDHRPDGQAQYLPPQRSPADINPLDSELDGRANTGPIKLLIRRAGFETLAAHSVDKL